MVPERVTITIRSDLGEDGPLTVGEALRQVVDFFELLTTAQGENAAAVNWRLVSVTKSSPLQATAEPFAVVAGVDVTAVARLAKRAVYSAFDEITSEGTVPRWLDASAREKIRHILARNTNGIGRTDIKLDDHSPVMMLVTKKAHAGLAALDRAEADIVASEPDLTKSEIGSIEGNVADATTFRKQPALRIRDRRTNAEVLCVFSDELARRTADHRWREVWDGERVRVYGRIQYNRKGVPASIRADDITEIRPRELSYSDIADPNFTGGLGPVEYLESEQDIA